MNVVLYWISWIILFVSSTSILQGGRVELKHGKSKGIMMTFYGFIGLAVSGLLMTIAYGVPGQ